MCKTIDEFPEGSDKIEMVIAAANVHYNYTGDQTCFQIESSEPTASEPQNHKTAVSYSFNGWGWQVQII